MNTLNSSTHWILTLSSRSTCTLVDSGTFPMKKPKYLLSMRKRISWKTHLNTFLKYFSVSSKRVEDSSITSFCLCNLRLFGWVILVFALRLCSRCWWICDWWISWVDLIWILLWIGLGDVKFTIELSGKGLFDLLVSVEVLGVSWKLQKLSRSRITKHQRVLCQVCPNKYPKKSTQIISTVYHEHSLVHCTQ